MSDVAAALALARTAATQLRERTGVERHDVLVVLGSGWDEATDALGERTSRVDVPMHDLAGFPAPTAMGHGGTVRSVRIGDVRVLMMLGRVHLYEGHEPSTVVHGVRTAFEAGARTAVLTNGAGFLDRSWAVGQLVLISDHLNLTGRSPLTGPNPPAPYAGRFVDLTDAYSPRLRALARTVDPTLPDGVYAGFHGPQFETPAEIRMAAALGADLVGMSTVLETIAARHLGMEVLGLSLATNPAAGLGGALSAQDVLDAGRSASGRLATFLDAFLRALASSPRTEPDRG